MPGDDARIGPMNASTLCHLAPGVVDASVSISDDGARELLTDAAAASDGVSKALFRVMTDRPAA